TATTGVASCSRCPQLIFRGSLRLSGLPSTSVTQSNGSSSTPLPQSTMENNQTTTTSSISSTGRLAFLHARVTWLVFVLFTLQLVKPVEPKLVAVHPK